MRRLLSAACLDGGQGVGLPVVVEQLLVDVVGDGFVPYCCGPKSARERNGGREGRHLSFITLSN
jgi:hypothetical protein